jgi:hypothetical protein
MQRRTGTVGSVALTVVALGVSGCVGEREFPTPTQMCENLVRSCGAPILLESGNDFYRGCYEIGVAGQKDRTNEDQCFAYHDECINDCEFFRYYLALDAAADADSGVDAGTELDAAHESSDSATSDTAAERDE